MQAVRRLMAAGFDLPPDFAELPGLVGVPLHSHLLKYLRENSVFPDSHPNRAVALSTE